VPALKIDGDDFSMEDDAPKSRTQKKKEDRELQKLGEQLVELSPEQLAAVAIPDELAQAVQMGRTMTRHGARRRQLQYIGALMRKVDAAPIRHALENIRQGDYQKVLAFQKLERWRDALKDGDLALIEKILAQCPRAERQRLNQLARNAQKEAGKGVSGRASRTLFKYLREIATD
jgi:ribosome-associated protein